MQSIPVKYEKGVFIPLETLQEIDEGVIGEVHIKEADKVEAIKSFPFFGLWKDREDISDGLSYVRNLRDQQRYGK